MMEKTKTGIWIAIVVLAVIAAYILNTAGIYVLAKQIFPWLDYTKTLAYFFKVLVINFALCWLINMARIAAQPHIAGLLNLFCGFAAYALVLLLINAGYNLNEDIMCYFYGNKNKP